MKALILNSGLGHRMGDITKTHPKCMTQISDFDTILSRQLHMLAKAGVEEIVMTTGYFDQILIDYCHSLQLPLRFTFVNNPVYAETNYIYSIYCAREALQDDVLLLHGDLVFEESVLADALRSKASVMTVSSTLPLPDKDFKAVIKNGKIEKVGIEFFNDALPAQPLYKLLKTDWLIWLNEIIRFCERGDRKCYAENAFNQISSQFALYPLDVQDKLCNEIDNPEDLVTVSTRIKAL